MSVWSLPSTEDDCLPVTPVTCKTADYISLKTCFWFPATAETADSLDFNLQPFIEAVKEGFMEIWEFPHFNNLCNPKDKQLHEQEDCTL